MSTLIQVVVSGLLTGGVYGLVTVGLTLIFGVIKLVNFAHGDFLMVSMYVTYGLFFFLGLDPYISIIIAVPVIFVFGILIERILMKPILSASHVVQIFATMGLSLVLQNGILMLFGADFLNVHTSYSNSVIKIGSVSLSLPQLVAFIVALISTIVLYVFLQRSNLGMCMRAVAQDDKAAKLVGINVDQIYLWTYAIGTALVGLAGVVLTPIYPAFPTIGLNFAFVAFVCVVLGGLGSVPGAMLGGLTVGLVEALAGYYVGSQFQQAAYFLIFLLILIFRPNGFFGRRGEELVQ